MINNINPYYFEQNLMNIIQELKNIKIRLYNIEQEIINLKSPDKYQIEPKKEYESSYETIKYNMM